MGSDLYVGGIWDLADVNDMEWAAVHATQTVHNRLFGWDRYFNRPERNHPAYKYYEEDNRLSLNWVDGPGSVYEEGGVEVFLKVLDFIDKWIRERKVLVHCDQGISRSPSLCLLFLAKRLRRISNSSFQEAKTEFVEVYPRYMPGGIGRYLEDHWKEIR